MVQEFSESSLDLRLVTEDSPDSPELVGTSASGSDRRLDILDSGNVVELTTQTTVTLTELDFVIS